MNSLEHVNGQQAVIDAVLRRRDTRKKEIIVATGSPGSGVTWTLEQAAETWETAGGVALHARGESFATERKLFPWLNLALPGVKRLARNEVLKGSVAQTSRLIPVVGAVTSYLLEELLNYQKKRLAREAIQLTAPEHDLLFVIQNAARRKRLLLTIDNLDVWDESSWTLLQLILSSNLDNLYPVLADALILVGASGEIPSRLLSLNTKLPITEFKIRPLERQEISIAISTFTLPIVTREEGDILYDVTDGRLDLLHDLSLHLRETSIANIATGQGNFYDSIIERRMRTIGGETRELEDLLAAAAILGQTFTVDDIRCLTGHPPEKLDANLNLATAAHLISAIGELARFQSAALHSHFHRAHVTEHAKYHEKFAECLQAMRPSEYGYRLHHLVLAGNTDNALICYALAVLAARRERSPAPESGDLTKASGWSAVRGYLDTMHTAYEAYDKRHLSEGLQILDTVEDFLPDVLVAERDYLEAQFLLKSHHIDKFKRAVELLSRWRDLKSREAEVWARIVQVLMVALVQTDRVEEARQIEGEVSAYYWSRQKVDPWALYGLNVLRRRSECLHYFFTATQRLENALAYFGPQDSESPPRHPIQYYYTLTNLVGNLMASGKFSEAHARALELDGLVRDNQHMAWPVLDIAVNNFILAGYLNGDFEAAMAATLLEQALKGPAEMADSILMENNCAVFLIRGGAQLEARALLERTYVKVVAGSTPDVYHRYFVGNNLAALLALAGEAALAESLRQEIGRGLEWFYPAVRETLKKRHELLVPAFADALQLGVERFDTYLTDRYPSQIGPQWAFYGRGFLLSDIQFWSAD